MNNRGFTLIELLTVIVMLAIISGIAVVSLQNVRTKNDETYYHTLEETVKLAGSSYFSEHRDLLINNKVYVTISQLVEENVLNNVYDTDGSACTGKVVAAFYNNKYNYIACLECAGYKTGDNYCLN